jgi:hypothetical protein
MDAVSKIADTCETAAREMEDEFTIWQQYIMDLYEAVVEQQGHTETQFATASNEAAAKKVLQESHEQTLAEHKTKVATIEGRVTELYDSYKDIQSKFPTGYVLIFFCFALKLFDVKWLTMINIATTYSKRN